MPQELRSHRLEEFLRKLHAEPREVIDARRIAVVVAHPDDETIGCGAALTRMSGVRIVVLTDGAPRDLKEARKLGFPTAAEYARVRLEEFRAALDIAGIPHSCATSFAVPDQAAVDHLAEIAFRLADLFTDWGIEIALTHSFEGGHPDHDAAAFAVHAGGALSAGAAHAVAIVEMPYYRASETGEIKQSFADPNGEVAVRLTREEVQLKCAILSCYASQREVLAGFSAEIERFRRAPLYDFSELPNGGRLLYEAHDWNMSAARWRERVSAAQRRINEDTSSCGSRS